MIENQNEIGRSMVEMLGVLALMGLLAILGVKGYKLAMERVAATSIMNELNRRSVIYSQQMMSQDHVTAFNSSEMADTISGGYTFSATPMGTTMFSITVENVDKDVCSVLARMPLATAIRTTVDGQVLTDNEKTICQRDTSAIEYIFTKLLRPCKDCLDEVRVCSSKADCSANEECQQGICICSIPCGDVCCPSGQVCINGACSAQQRCTVDADCDNGICFSDGLCGCRSWRDCNDESYCVYQASAHYTCSGRSDVASGSDTGPGGWVASTIAMRPETARDFCDKYGKAWATRADLGAPEKEYQRFDVPEAIRHLTGRYWVQGVVSDTCSQMATVVIPASGQSYMGGCGDNAGHGWKLQQALCY